MKIIVGFGNPGKKFEGTRHNTGFLVIQSLLASKKVELKQKATTFRFCELSINGEQVVFAQPTLFMNESGRSLQGIATRFGVKPEACLVVLDDVNLPLGKIRFREKGSAGGHNGLQSVIDSLGTELFPRLRIGVGGAEQSIGELSDYVLGRFSKEEQARLTPHIERAKDACLEWISGDFEALKQRFNG